MSTTFSWSQGGLSPVRGSSQHWEESLVTSPAEKETGSWSDGNIIPLTTSTPQPTLASVGSTSTLSTTTTSDGSQHSAGTKENHEKDHDGSDGQAPVGAIAGGTTAFIVLLIGMALALWIIRRKRQRRKSRGKHPAVSLAPSFEEDAIVSSQIEPFLAPESSGNLGQTSINEKAEDFTPYGRSATRGFFEYAQQERGLIHHVSNTPEPSSIQREMSEMRAEIERLRRVALRASFSGGESTDRHGVTTVPPPAYEE